MNAPLPPPAVQTAASPGFKPDDRFVWVIGSIREEYPDIPETVGADGGIVLWDRAHRAAVCVLSAAYAQAFCLETTRENPCEFPFTNLERWFNSLTAEELASENLPPAEPRFARADNFDNTQAISEGWALFNDGELQRIDDPHAINHARGLSDEESERLVLDGQEAVFTNDEAARSFVRYRAAQGSAYHQHALSLLSSV